MPIFRYYEKGNISSYYILAPSSTLLWSRHMSSPPSQAHRSSSSSYQRLDSYTPLQLQSSSLSSPSQRARTSSRLVSMLPIQMLLPCPSALPSVAPACRAPPLQTSRAASPSTLPPPPIQPRSPTTKTMPMTLLAPTRPSVVVAPRQQLAVPIVQPPHLIPRMHPSLHSLFLPPPSNPSPNNTSSNLPLHKYPSAPPPRPSNNTSRSPRRLRLNILPDHMVITLASHNNSNHSTTSNHNMIPASTGATCCHLADMLTRGQAALLLKVASNSVVSLLLLLSMDTGPHRNLRLVKVATMGAGEGGAITFVTIFLLHGFDVFSLVCLLFSSNMYNQFFYLRTFFEYRCLVVVIHDSV